MINEFHEVLALWFGNLMEADDMHHHLMVSYQTCWSRTKAPNGATITDASQITFDCAAGKNTGFSDDTYNCDPLCSYQWWLWNNAFKMQYVQALGLFYVYSVLYIISGSILFYLWYIEASKMLNINSTADMLRA